MRLGKTGHTNYSWHHLKCEEDELYLCNDVHINCSLVDTILYVSNQVELLALSSINSTQIFEAVDFLKFVSFLLEPMENK